MFTDLAVEQARRGWDVTALACNRSWHDPHARLPAHEEWNGVHIHRVFRPPWDQARPSQRLGNSAWMLPAWFLRTLRLGRFDAIVIGSDPAFSPLVALGAAAGVPARRARALVLRPLSRKRSSPKAPARPPRRWRPLARRLMGLAYRRFDALVDIGPRMRRAARRLRQRRAPGDAGAVGAHRSGAARSPSTPPRAPRCFRARSSRCCIPGRWAARTISRRSCAWRASAARARATRSRSASPCAATALPSCAPPSRPDDTNVRLVDFADARTRCTARLAAADVHLISLRDDWAGVVVPSKFFASLAVGRPVLYAGPAESEIARWIAENDLGLHLRDDDDSAGAVADRLHAAHRRSPGAGALAGQRARRLPAAMVEAGDQRSLEHAAPGAGRRHAPR